MPNSTIKANMFRVFSSALKDLRDARTDRQRLDALEDILQLAMHCDWPLLRSRARDVIDSHVDQFPTLAY